MTSARDCRPPEWEATCEVCGWSFGWNEKTDPPQGGVFCPNCRDEKRQCLGVLNFVTAEPPHE